MKPRHYLLQLLCHATRSWLIAYDERLKLKYTNRDISYFTVFQAVSPHRADAAYCYGRLGVWSSVCLSVTTVSPAKRLNRLRCRVRYWLGWVYYIGVKIHLVEWEGHF